MWNKTIITAALSASLFAMSSRTCAQDYGYSQDPNMRGNFDPRSQRTPSGQVEMRQGQCFQYAIPAGWNVAEDGSHAVVLTAPDNCAVTIMTGNAGLPVNYNPAQFVQEKLALLRVENLRLSQPRQAQPAQGYSAACEFEYAYTANGVPCRGVAKVSVQPAYDTCSMVLTAAASMETQWGQYASWLPQVAGTFAAADGRAFGSRGVMAGNIQISREQGERERVYREQSQKQWDEVVRDRNESQDRNNVDFREANIGNVRKYDNPHEGRTEELSANNKVYWVNRTTGQIVGSDNASFDPRTPGDVNWEPMQQAPWNR